MERAAPSAALSFLLPPRKFPRTIEVANKPVFGDAAAAKDQLQKMAGSKK